MKPGDVHGSEDGIRTAEPGDASALASLHRRASMLDPSTLAQLSLQPPEWFGVPSDALDSGYVRVLLVRGAIVGFATAVPRNDGTAELEDLFVEPNQMRRGIGTALVRDAVRRMRSRSIRSIEVTANANAEGFYRAVGFVRTGIAGTEFGPAVRMRLSL